MKILLVSQDNSEKLNIGGKHIHQNLLIAAWRKQGHEVRTIFPRPQKITMPIWTRIIFRISRTWSTFPVFFFKKYLRKIKNELIHNLHQSMTDFSPDLISAQDPMAAVACSAALQPHKGALPRIALTLHGYYTWEMINYGYYGEHNKPTIEKIGFELEREALEKANSVITVDSRIRDYLQTQHGFTEPVDVIFNAINIEPFQQPINQEVMHLQKRLAPNGEKIILIARRLVLKNGVHVAISAIALLIPLKKNIRLIVVGDGPESFNLQSQAKTLGIESYIDFIGNIDHSDIHNYYRAADILLMPSIPSDGIEEATSLSMLEGMAAGKLVICSAIGGMKEIIIHKKNGYLVKSNNPQNLSELLNDLLETPPDQLDEVCTQARQFAFDNHDYNSHARKILSKMSQN
ncbi:glycosyltransferase family 4 protein [Vogesella sp. LIG4]|uniref:glycosyltransferase family 4 protein n=1 Tax=Vogesella sp. LIG4 TaxID=1192162 RepID=UPI0008201672|nr:glycosyltransferase family 4 protein [Vogesella sp. LIG4]SCK09350.1 Glycosyltransferase involved in cell wall bisynthesis [Vogesella sp. LIG4]